MSQGDGSEGQATTTQSQPTNSETSDGNGSDDATSGEGDDPESEGQTDDTSTDNGSTDTTEEDDDTPTDISGGNGGTTTGGSGGSNGDDSSDTGSGSGNDSTSGDEDDITLSSAEVDSGERTTLPLVLESASEGMAGFQSTVTADTGLVTIENATIADDFENLSSVSVADDGSSVTVKALDVNETAEPGATDVQLATLTIEGVESGTTALRLTSDRFEDDDGDPRPVSTTDGEVTVTS
ncbi:hypothetical protein [Natrinema salsiterrestre]|uniref:Uncharacterized protein n=1 Tax=Natrinema salsiterrestre TaxID=2950540 RepID=A0A9Q4L3I0_9EURY|nr:hypothetical protein [Natrinema salsiterrestre]MDF9745250.1 hypothetical protein [Natrinema salsiterrestre]